MKKSLIWLLFFALQSILISGTGNLQANHIIGSEFTYECLGGCQYRIHTYAYRDCSGSASASFTSASIVPDTGTYCGTPLWQDASPYSPNLTNFAQINCVAGFNPGGPGFIGGLISQCANKQTDPVSDLSLILINDLDSVISATQSDVNGYFSFPNLAEGTYRILADAPNIDTSRAPVLQILPGVLTQDSLLFILHPDWLELVVATHLQNTEPAGFQAAFAPNPFSDQLKLELDLPETAPVSLTLRNIQGQLLQSVNMGNVAVGTHTLGLSTWSHFPKGVYLVEVESNGKREVLKLIHK